MFIATALEIANIRSDGFKYYAARRHPLHSTFVGMKTRCLNPKNPAYPRYGGRGIRVCERWLMPNGIGWRNFLSDMGERPEGFTLERINNDGNYEPSNCRWASRYDQYRNRSSNVWIERNGERRIKADWSRKAGGHRGLITLRTRNGMSVEEAISKPAMPRDESLRLGAKAHAHKKRSQTRCKRGHEFTSENTSWAGGVRTCRVCRRAHDMRLYYGKVGSVEDYIEKVKGGSSVI